MGRLDQTIVNLALPKIINDFAITVSAAGWIATAYILANAVFVPVWGKLGDTVGRKKVYLMGFGIFIIGSALAGLAWNLSSMIVFRIIQAVASSADYPTAMAILAFTFKEGRERAQALGIWSSVFAASAVVGPLLGGPIIDNFGWRWVFFINIPVGIIGLLMALVFVPESTGRETVSFDWWGALTLGTALSSLVLVLDQGTSWGWTSLNSMLCYVGVVVFITVFYFIERASLLLLGGRIADYFGRKRMFVVALGRLRRRLGVGRPGPRTRPCSSAPAPCRAPSPPSWRPLRSPCSRWPSPRPKERARAFAVYGGHRLAPATPSGSSSAASSPSSPRGAGPC